MIQARRVDFIAQPVRDLRRAEDFYGGTLGLMRNPGSGDRWVEYETGNLTIGLSTFGGAVALRVDDVGEARATLEAAGVEFAMETFDSGVCRGAPFTDPDGNRLMLHQRYLPADTWELRTADVERTDFIGVSVNDRQRAGAFYRDMLGIPRNELSHDEWPEFDAGNIVLLLSTPAQRNEPEFKASDARIALRVRDVAASMERLRGAGIEFLFEEPYDSGVCHMAFFRDPDGNSLMLHHRYAPYRDGSLP